MLLQEAGEKPDEDSPSGNPQARNLFEVIQHLQKVEGLHFELTLRAASESDTHIAADLTLAPTPRTATRREAVTKIRPGRWTEAAAQAGLLSANQWQDP